MKISLLCDQTALPDAREGKLAFEATYPFLLDRSLKRRYGAESPVVVERAELSRGIGDVLRDWTEEVSLKRPDVVVIHAGVRDAMPRRPFLRVGRRGPGLPPAIFSHKLDEIAYRAGVDRVRRIVFVTLLPNAPVANVTAYNEALVRQADRPGFDVVDMENLASRNGGAQGFSTDGLHLTPNGHRWLAVALEALALRDAFPDSPRLPFEMSR